MEIGRGIHIGTAMNRSSSLLQLPSFSYVLMFLYWRHVATSGRELLFTTMYGNI